MVDGTESYVVYQTRRTNSVTMIADAEGGEGVKIPEISTANRGEICEGHLHQQCARLCTQRHCLLPYQWQVLVQDTSKGESQWLDFVLEQNVLLETAYCNPNNDKCILQIQDGQTNINMEVSFETFDAVLPVANAIPGRVPVRRLSTQSYATDSDAIARGGGDFEKLVTQWRWYWCSGGSWRPFGEPLPMPHQYTVEKKFMYGQPLYRFEVEPEGDFLIDLRPGFICMRCLKTNTTWPLRRRPLFYSPSAKPLPCPVIKPVPFASSLPRHWFPVDTDQESELIPLDPDKLVYHLIASAFYESIQQTHRTIVDIFSVQNPFLYQKYFSKRKQMQLKRQRLPFPSSTPLELQLFHGTRDQNAVQAICRHNFDPRVSGSANDTVFGKGAYFARDAQFSDRYAQTADKSRRCWMFLARVLVGRQAIGKREFVRPPLVYENRPHGDLYDSCVNSLSHPSIYVIFDSDQCYPEYLISYMP